MTRAILALAVSLAFASVARAVEDIPDVNTLEDLQKSALIKVDDWEVRLGLGDGGEGAQSWKLIYCFAKYVGPEAGDGAEITTADDPEVGIRALGPVTFWLKDGHGVKIERLRHALARLVPRGGLYVAVLPLPGPGDFVLEAMNDRDEAIARRNLAVRREAGHPWVKFATMPPTPKKDPPELAVSSSLILRWWPKIDGTLPILEGKTLSEAADKPLPAKLTPGGIELKLEQGAFVLRSEVGLEWDPRHLLARWRVNGVPPRFDVLEGLEAAEALRKRTRSKEARVAFALPGFLGAVKPGDKVALQVLYSPEEVEYVRPPGEMMRIRRLVQDLREKRDDEAQTPLLSNRLEFEVTAEMLKAVPAREPR